MHRVMTSGHGVFNASAASNPLHEKREIGRHEAAELVKIAKQSAGMLANMPLGPTLSAHQ
jgi:hypothetical protein